MNTWLFLEAQLRFSDRLRVITTRRYFADMQVEDNDLYHGMFFVSAPPQINPGEVVTVQIGMRNYPQDPCTEFQSGTRILLKEGPITRAEGSITRRWEHRSSAGTVIELQNELMGC